MALTTCKECGGQVSSSARKCPHCGKRRTTLVTKIVGLFFVLVVASAVWGSIQSSSAPASSSGVTRPAWTPEQQAQYACETFVRKTLHDPDSAEFTGFTSPAEEKGGVYFIQAQLRARNGFHALRMTAVNCRVRREKDGGWTAVSLKEIR